MLLTTNRLLLREFEESDWQAVLHYQRDPLYLRYNPWDYRMPEEVQGFVNRFILWSHEQPRRRFQFAITLRTTDQLIGNAGIRMKFANAWDADLGYELDSRHWGQGYATEAATALLTLGFKDLHLHRIWATCISENTASAHVLQKIGMRLEGHQRQNEWMKNRWWDTLQFAILDHEWHTQR